MKKKKVVMIMAAFGIVVLVGSVIHVSAEKSSITSKGNFILESGDRAAFYAEDIEFLKDELNDLFNEMD